MNRMLAPARITMNVENIEAPSAALTSTEKLCEMRKVSDARNSTTRNRINIPDTVQLRTPWRSSLMTMGFSSHSRQLRKWDLSLAIVTVITKKNIQHSTFNVQRST